MKVTPDVEVRARLRHEYYKKNKEIWRERSKAWKAANPEKVKFSNKKDSLKRKYGLTWEVYENFYHKQNGKCGICFENKPMIGNGIQAENPLCVDHCHNTGEVRGLLCQSCNVGLGNLRDSITFLENAKNYLINYGKH